MKKKLSSVGSVVLAGVMVLSLTMVMAVPGRAASLTDVTADPDVRTAGATATYTITFTTATPLAYADPADRIIIKFPEGFDAGKAAVDAEGTVTPSETDPTLVDATETVVTLAVKADEPAGLQTIVLTGIVNTHIVGRYTVTVQTDDGAVPPEIIDGPTQSAQFVIEGINLDREGYRTGDTVYVTVGDEAANDPDVVDTVSVVATSCTMPHGITIALHETGVDTAIFTGSFVLVGVTPEVGQLLVDHGDTITVTYTVTEEIWEATAKVDDVAPVFTKVADGEFHRNTDTITLTVVLGEPGLTVTADFSSIDSGYSPGDENVVDHKDGTYTVTYTITEGNIRPDGKYIIPVTATDIAGNSTTDKTFSTTLDNTMPVVTEPTASPPVVQPNVQTDVTFTVTVRDVDAGIESVTIDLSPIEGAAQQPMFDDGTHGDAEAGDGVFTWKQEDVKVAADTYELTVKATDRVDNLNDTVAVVLRVIEDVTAPVIATPEVTYPVGVYSARVGDEVVITAVVTDDIAGVHTVEVDATAIGQGETEAMTLVEGTWKVTLPVGDGVAPGEKTLTIRATDLAGNEATLDFTVLVTKRLTGFNIELEKGWNLISLPLIPDDPAIEVVLADIYEDVRIVWHYDAAAAPDERWLSYVPGVPSDLTEMRDGWGYWVDMESPATLTVRGVEVPPAPVGVPPIYEVVPGWNLIGFKSTQEVKAADYLTGVTFHIIWHFDEDIGEFVLVMPDEYLYPGEGYWVAILEPGTIFPAVLEPELE